MDKPIILEIDNIRIRRFDDNNVFIEREETYYSPKDKGDITSYKFKGYSNSLISALRLIYIKGLLLDKDGASDLNELLKQVLASEQRIIKEIRGIRHGS